MSFLVTLCLFSPGLYRVGVPGFPNGPLFHRGKAMATAFVLLLDQATGGTQSDGDTGRIKIR